MSKEYNDRQNKPLINPAFHMTMKMKVIEVIQFDTGMVEGKNFKTLAETLPTSGYGTKTTEIDPDKKPSKGHVWFKEGEDGTAQMYKANWDSSG